MSLVTGAINLARKQCRALLRRLRRRRPRMDARGIGLPRTVNPGMQPVRGTSFADVRAVEVLPVRRKPRPEMREVTVCLGCESARTTGELCVLRERAYKNGSIRIAALGCLECGLAFASCVPTKEALAKTYAPDGDWGRRDVVQRRHEGLSPSALALAGAVREFGGPLAARPTVLDIGCGVGHILDAFAHEGYLTAGIEPSTDVAFSAHTRLEHVPAADAYDVVVLHHVLEHLDTPFEMLARAAHAVRDGGVLVIGTPSLDALSDHRNLRYVLNGGHHLCALSIACLKTVLRQSGFHEFQVLDRGETTLRIRMLARKVTSAGPEPVEDLEAPLRALAEFGTRPAQPAVPHVKS